MLSLIILEKRNNTMLKQFYRGPQIKETLQQFLITIIIFLSVMSNN